jgi:hypothetical protein
MLRAKLTRYFLSIVATTPHLLFIGNTSHSLPSKISLSIFRLIKETYDDDDYQL